MFKGLFQSLIKAVKDLTKAFVTFWETLAGNVGQRTAEVIVIVLTINLTVMALFFVALSAFIIFWKLVNG